MRGRGGKDKQQNKNIYAKIKKYKEIKIKRNKDTNKQKRYKKYKDRKIQRYKYNKK